MTQHPSHAGHGIDGYDLIGDIHGCETALQTLLKRLGYRDKGGVMRHRSRKAIFLGDFIDRHPGRGVIAIVRPMVEQGSALAVIGNHEFNALGFGLPHPELSGRRLRERLGHTFEQHQPFIEEFQGNEREYLDTLSWFQTLPLWLDLGELRVVHAVWDEGAMALIKEQIGTTLLLLNTQRALPLFQCGTLLFEAAEFVLKGIERPLPAGVQFKDTDGKIRNKARIKWWLEDGKSYRWQDAVLGPPSLTRQLGEKMMMAQDFPQYPSNAPPVFVGHYWLSGEPAPLSTNVACLDYSIARGGALVAYRWDGEQTLVKERFLAVTN